MAWYHGMTLYDFDQCKRDLHRKEEFLCLGEWESGNEGHSQSTFAICMAETPNAEWTQRGQRKRRTNDSVRRRRRQELENRCAKCPQICYTHDEKATGSCGQGCEIPFFWCSIFDQQRNIGISLFSEPFDPSNNATLLVSPSTCLHIERARQATKGNHLFC